MRPAYSQQIKAYRRNISIQRNIGGRKNRIVTVGAIKPGSHQPQSQFGITGVMRSTDNAKIEFFILLLFISVIEVVQELLEKLRLAEAESRTVTESVPAEVCTSAKRVCA